ncbi:MAG: cytochrome c/FTR1 family iron permease [Gammaproteobacteria bacterium]|nr:cytochrome c/FTR1 family iron permease [Gammaproteobacteria bacterium]
MRQLLLSLCLLITPVAFAGERQQLLQLLDYVGVDYAEAVAEGEVVNAAEYAEMREFAGAVATTLKALPWHEAKATLQQEAVALKVAIEGKRPPADIAAITGSMRGRVMSSYEVVAVPVQQPDTTLAKQLYSSNCAACHGVGGMGDGPAANGLEPAPTNFLDLERASQRSLFGLYNTITLGVSETAMGPYSQLSDHERWSLAFYVGTLAYPAAAKGVMDIGTTPIATLQQLTTTTLAESHSQYGEDGAAAMASLRRNPASLFAKNSDPLTLARTLLSQSVSRYSQGAPSEAQQLAVTAYLEGFEIAESSLGVKDAALSKRIEGRMAAYRNLLRNGAPLAQVSEQQQELDVMLAQAEEVMAQQGLSSWGAFTSALVILLREGLEAILVLAALIAFLIKTGRRDTLPYLHAGWIAAIIAGGVTWWASVSLFTISGAMREVTEGIAALAAAGILFYVGFWMHGKTSNRAWQQFIEGSAGKALKGTTLWSMTGLAFISVYREMFETILFYQAIWVQSDSAGHGMMLGGMVSAAVILLILGWFILRYSTRLPLRQFFAVTGAFLFLLAVIFAGKGIGALQEAGNIPYDPLHLPLIGAIGFSDSVQGLLVQGVMVALTAWLLWGRNRGAVA